MGSGNWIVDNLNSALEMWNGRLAEIWQLITTSPENFKGGGIWNVIVNINDGLKAVGYALLVLFFVMGVVKTCGSFAEMKKPEMAFKCFIRFVLAQAAVSWGMELMTGAFRVSGYRPVSGGDPGDHQEAPHRSQRGAQAGGIDCVSALGKGQLLLGWKEPCAWMGLSLGNAYGGDSGRQLQQRDRAPVRLRLFGIRRLGILQPVWRQLYHRPWRRRLCPAQLLHTHQLERCQAGRPRLLPWRQSCGDRLWL